MERLICILNAILSIAFLCFNYARFAAVKIGHEQIYCAQAAPNTNLISISFVIKLKESERAVVTMKKSVKCLR